MFNPIALRKAKIVYNFGLSECIRVKKIAEKLQYRPALFWSSISVSILRYIRVNYTDIREVPWLSG